MDVCFRMPPYRYPQYEVRLWTRYNLTGSPWTKDYYSFNVSGNASVPDRPPKFVPKGFSYEPRSTDLYVYWVGLSMLEFGGPDFTYILESDTGNRARLENDYHAVFYDWDPTKPANVFIWSQNFLGKSVNSSVLKVPILANSQRRDPQNLRFNVRTNSLIWQPPDESKGLTGYTIFWCDTYMLSTFCGSQLKLEELPASETQFRFEGHWENCLWGVAAIYEDNSGTGIHWVFG